MKRYVCILLIFLSLVMAFSLIACDEGGTSTTTNDTTTNDTTTNDTTTNDTTTKDTTTKDATTGDIETVTKNAGGDQTHIHNFVERAEDAYLIERGTCQSRAVYFKVCEECGEKSDETFVGEFGEHELYFVTGYNATCTADGLTDGEKCKFCDYSTQETIPAGHSLVTAEAQPATCTADGWDAYEYCVNCDYSTKVILPATGHIEKVVDDDKEKTASCVDQVTYLVPVFCETCGEWIRDEEVTIEPVGHDFQTYDGKEATCTEDGWETYTICRRCGESTYRKIEALGHDWSNYNGQSATCTEDGYESYKTCNRCGESTYKAISANGHKWQDISAKEPTCTEDGYTAYRACAVCGEKENYEIIQKTGHTPADAVQENAVSATCEKEGSYDEVVYCSVCNGVISRVKKTVAKLAHTWVEQNGREPDCLNGGYAPYHYCSVCHYTTYKRIEALGHDFVHHEAQEATCTENGWGAYDTCSRCSYTTYTSDTEIAKLGHDYVFHEGVKATCTTDGYAPYLTCTRCDLNTYKVLKATGHQILSAEAKSVTCEADGWDAYEYCVNTGCTYTTKVTIPATGHKWVHHDRIEPTCTDQGWIAYDSCENCSKQNPTLDFIPALGHTVLETKENIVEPTCTEKGSYELVRTCTTCGKELVRAKETVARLEHIEKMETVTPPTCTEKGTDHTICTRCGDVLGITLTDALGHDYKITGLYGTCTRCGKVLRYYYDTEDENYIYFGSYPQTRVTDEAELEKLDKLLNNTVPTADESLGWTSYGYWKNGEVVNDIWYLDIGISEEKYRAVYFTAYRSVYTDRETTETPHQQTNGYETGTVYWFKFEPLKWRILTTTTDKARALIYCVYAIDAQQYHHYDGINGTKVFEDENGEKTIPLNYAESDIRRWLEETFYETAFNDLQKAIIQTVQNANDYESTHKTFSYAMDYYYDCGETTDKVFLLSTNQYYSYVQYDFGTTFTDREWADIEYATDYAKAQGVYVAEDGGSCTMLRSLKYGNRQGYEYLESVIFFNQLSNGFGTSTQTTSGIHPAMWIELG